MGEKTEFRKKIFVIDDEEDLREIVSFQFQAKGYDVATAADGQEALERLEEVLPDLIILDLNMPRLGGIEFYQKICDHHGHPLYPVLILTARANTRQLFLDFEVDGFMTKPFDIAQLISEAEFIIRKKHDWGADSRQDVLMSSKSVFVADPNPESLAQIVKLLSKSGYRVNMATSGGQAIEKMYADSPDVAFIHLGLEDVPGDVVIQRVTRLAKTMRTKCILFLNKNGTHDQVIIEKFSQKTGIMQCLEYEDISQILALLDSLD